MKQAFSRVHSALEWVKHRLSDISSLQETIASILSNAALWLKLGVWMLIITVITTLPGVPGYTHSSCLVACCSWSSVRFAASLLASPSCAALALLRSLTANGVEEDGVLDDCRVPDDLCLRCIAPRAVEEKDRGGADRVAEESDASTGEGGERIPLSSSFSFIKGL